LILIVQHLLALPYTLDGLDNAVLLLVAHGILIDITLSN
jgi:hypothetical protein